MNFKSLLNNEQLLTILHNVLTNESTINKVSNVSVNGEDYSYNQYSLLIVMDLVIKYQIIISDETYHNYFFSKLNNIITNYKSHQDLIIKCNSLLLELTSKKLNLKMTNRENKQLILKHIYNRYIVNGYCFHSFPSVFKKDVEENGLISKIDKKEVYDLKKINYIFDHHNYKNLISKNLNSKSTPLYITDSPAMAYYYAFRSPEYMAELTSLSKYYNYVEDYDKSAYYLKDYQKCKSNLVSLCKHVNMTTKEENTILKSFDRRWSSLKLSDSTPCIAFIKRSDLAKNSLPNIKEIIEMVDEVELPILLSKITDSKYPVIRRYSDIDPLDLTVITMPSYKEIKNYHKKSKEEVIDNIEIVEKRRRFNLRNAYSYGNASILALSGLLFISLGLTLTIILKVLGG